MRMGKWQTVAQDVAERSWEHERQERELPGRAARVLGHGGGRLGHRRPLDGEHGIAACGARIGGAGTRARGRGRVALRTGELAHVDEPAALASWARWPLVTAVRNHTVYSVSSDRISRTTVRILEGAEEICAKLSDARKRLVR